ncbi:MAG: PleD family two-component system response regulator [Candidatus Odinarchaeota archaeon]
MPLLLVVEDQPGILLNLRITLEYNGFEVLTARNGQEALDLLSSTRSTPDLVISDIMMPEMDGYEFFKEVSNDPRLCHVPFVFLSARTSPEDIRFGKMLGVDDYITKPFEEEDLLAVITGKLVRKEKIESIEQLLKDRLITLLKEETFQAVPDEAKNDVYFLLVMWDEICGPDLKIALPDETEAMIPLEKISTQLFSGTVPIYGQEDFSEPRGVLLTIENINKDAYTFFDFMTDREVRGGQRQFMLAIIAPKINYFKTFRIRELFQDITKKVKGGKTWDARLYYEKLREMLTQINSA